MALASELTKRTGIDCTPCILGHIQRGGAPVAKDRILATKMGVSAVTALVDNKTNIMVAELNNAIHFVNLSDAVKHTKQVNQQLVDAQKHILSVTNQNQV